ncbi:MAG: DUF3828 domain-containing protein [Anaerolineae bacterium]|nr:DUF3828 domain-containing protein [Anaerolineae bacterium]
MRTRYNLPVLIAIALSLFLSGCVLPTREPSLSPQEVVTKFYRWYIGYPGNPLVDKEYRASPYLAESFVQEVDGTLASFDRGGGDPFLLAQDIPEQFTVDEVTVSGERAGVTINLYWGGNPTPSPRRVDLELIDGEWKITRVSLPEQ